MFQTTLTILSVSIVIQLSLLVVFLLNSKKGKRLSNLLLAAFFFLLIINISDGIVAFSGFFTRFPQLAHLEDGFVLLFGPVLYFYTRSMIFKDFRLPKMAWLHAVPFILLTILYQLFYRLQPIESQLKIQNAIVQHQLPVGFYLSMVLIYGQVAFYLLLSFRDLSTYKIALREHFASFEKVNMDWLSFMLIAFATLLSISIIYTFLPAVGMQRYFDPFFILALVSIFFFSIIVVWKGLSQPGIFSGIDFEEKPVNKYAGTIKETEKSSARSVLINLMESEKLFLDPDLTLEKLAQKTPFSSKKLSQLLNVTFSQSFFDFINTYRIKEAQRIFADSTDAKLTVLEVMYASGFNSKSSFNSLFKEKTGQTPSDFKRAVHHNKSRSTLS